MEPAIEYGIWSVRLDKIIRTGMTRDQAQAWMRQWYWMGGTENVYEIASRKVSPWLHLPTPPEDNSHG